MTLYSIDSWCLSIGAFKSSPMLTFDHAQPNQKKLVEYLMSGSVKKVEKLLESGIDPNFVMDDGSKST